MPEATKPKTASVSNRVSSVSVVTALAPITGPHIVIQMPAARTGVSSRSRRASPKTSSPVSAKASAFGSRAAHSLLPKMLKLAPIAQ